MYVPKAFREDDIVQLQTFMQANNFGILVSQQDGVPVAAHLPFILDTTRGSYGTLLAHMARANTQWRLFADAPETLVIFQGPHTYITPSWYDEPLSVPTWNYTAVHVYGRPRIIEDVAEMLALMETLTQQSESRFERPWQFAGLPQDFVEKKLRGTVCFEMEIMSLDGKFKLSQNRPKDDQKRVAATLQASSDPLDQEVAALMKVRQKK
ncbi:transcriptional regulator [Reticulibacter mediterranei]|uniref:Transcriptional regulator n=1 Tax=Reticulibacter mediterranei TaxID=2778369 RepID=A0A8J3IJI5_9CHLR|nr:FMN-binding negative transcriptional regulator [Reticulibacter mediterranei]GHO91935.1 transcriptional regulator [Reticulibacter mediterranei]